MQKTLQKYCKGTTGDNINLTLMPPPTAGVYSILAVVKAPKNGVEKWNLAGRLDVLARTPKTYSVTMVPLVEDQNINKGDVRDELNKTWNQYGISWEVDVDNEFYVHADDEYNKEFIDAIFLDQWEAGDEFLSNYTTEQKAINSTYNTYASSQNTYDNTRMYVFVLPADKAPYNNQIGDMFSETRLSGVHDVKSGRTVKPLVELIPMNAVISGPFGKQWGYLFVDNFGSNNSHYRTLSHELGHVSETRILGACEPKCVSRTNPDERSDIGSKTELQHTFAGDHLEERTTSNLMDYGTGTDLVRFQWEAIHNPALIGKLFQDDEDGAAVVSLDIDDSYENYFGYERILNYLLGDGREKMIESIELNNISDIQAIDPESAVGVIITALGDVNVGDPNEAVALVKEFLQTDSQRQIQLTYNSIYNELLQPHYEVFPQDFVQQRIYDALSYAAAISNITSRTIEHYNEIWDASRRLNFEELDAFRKGIVNTIEGTGDLVELTYAGKVNLLAKLSNTQFKKLYLKKFTTTTNRELSVIMNSVRSGNYDYSGVVNAMSNADQIDVLSNIDDLTLASLRNTSNFTLKLYDKVVGALDIGGSAIAFVQLSMIVKNNWEISPADVLSVIPSPFSLLSYWVEDVTQKLADDFEGIFWYNTRDYEMVIDWDEHMGTSIYPNEYLYLCYTDQADKCNTFTMPTSIVFMNEDDAMTVFGLSPSIVNCDYRSLIKVQSNNDIVFRPTFQFDINW